ncbi:hypothetical protein [Bremerella cremea]|uniref:hypothetical protein n=1 Tax=Bremerella cremea TaxID=1031537 RepID=UPI0031EEA991
MAKTTRYTSTPMYGQTPQFNLERLILAGHILFLLLALFIIWLAMQAFEYVLESINWLFGG